MFVIKEHTNRKTQTAEHQNKFMILLDTIICNDMLQTT